MNRWASTRRQLAATLVFAVLVTGGLAGATRLARTADACEQVLVASSQEKTSMLQGFAASYDAGKPQVGGRCVSVSVEKVDSGDAELALANGWTGPTRPEVWSPASSAWVKLLTAQAPAVAARLLPAGWESESLFQSPLVIGMPEPMADALGYTTTSIGWAQILRLTQDPRGWAAYGHPLWGKFKLGKTNPTVSTSGLHALIGAYFAAPGGAALTVPAVTSAPVEAFVREIEGSVVHYGQTATDFLQNLRYADEQGPDAPLRYISAIAVEEQELADYNAGLVAGIQHSPPKVKLVAIYPSDGTPVADHPYVVLGWSTDGQKAAARDFEDFIGRQTTTIEARHFRLSDGDATPALARLVYPGAQLPPLVRLEPPAGYVLKTMLDGWKRVRKAARVLILIDATAAAGTLSSALRSLAGAASGFEPQDKVGVWTFPTAGGQPGSHSVLRDVTENAGSLRATLAGVQPVKGASDLEGALHDAVTQMVANYDPTAINAVVVLELSAEPQAANIGFLETEAPLVRVFTVGPASELLKSIAMAADGTFYEPGAASHFLNDAISNF
ncbi:MAG TPA: substrate-binding domain-containing protein [Candidatus Acidoferrum sp.]|nr:substrate-binding domain-containing protein [Candidatus Acidoferrum sp.]